MLFGTLLQENSQENSSRRRISTPLKKTGPKSSFLVQKSFYPSKDKSLVLYHSCTNDKTRKIEIGNNIL